MLPSSGPPSPHRPTGYDLQAAKNSLQLTGRAHSGFGTPKHLQWVFIAADFRHTNLGADFLHHFGPSIAVTKSRLIHTLTHLQVHSISTQTVSACPALPCLNLQDPYTTVLSEFPNILRPHTVEQPTRHAVTHHICTTRSPVSACPHRLPPGLSAGCKARVRPHAGPRYHPTVV